MARNDIKILEPIEPKFSYDMLVAAGSAASIKSGEPTICLQTGYAEIMVDGNGSTGGRFAGIAKSDSTDTASAAGSVTLWLPLPGMVYSGVAKSSTAANTQAKINALIGKRVTFDLTSTTWTVDTAASDASTNCLTIIGGDYNTNTVYFTYNNAGTILGDVTV